MQEYTNDEGEVVVIENMDNFRLINAIAKYAEKNGKGDELTKALKSEALRRLSDVEGE